VCAPLDADRAKSLALEPEPLLPNTHIYDPWFDNTLRAISYAPVGALIASRHPANAVSWLFLRLFGLATSISHFGARYAVFALLAQPDSLPAGQALAWTLSWILPIIICLSVSCIPPRYR
jgi:hypothetical protein